VFLLHARVGTPDSCCTDGRDGECSGDDDDVDDDLFAEMPATYCSVAAARIVVTRRWPSLRHRQRQRRQSQSLPL